MTPLDDAAPLALRTNGEVCLAELDQGRHLTEIARSEAGPGNALVRFCAELAGARLSWLDLRFCDFGAHLAAAERLAPDVGSAARTRVQTLLAVACAWRSIFDGVPVAQAYLSEVGAAARSAGLRGAVVDVAMLRSWRASVAGDAAAALEAARVCCRMAAAEGLPLPLQLAELTLARARRRMGRPHQALWVLSGLRGRDNAPWLALASWEALLAGGGRLFDPAPDSAAEALASLLDRVRSGDASQADDTSSLLLERVAGAAPLVEEAALLTAALLPSCPEDAPEAVRAFEAGEVHELPCGLLAAALHPPAPRETLAYVIASPGRAGVRKLALAVPEAEAARAHAGDGKKPHERLDRALCTLALAGPAGLPEPTFFRSVYGFEFNKRLHGGSLNVLLFRLREELGAAAHLSREPGWVALLPTEPLIVPDPSCRLTTAEQVLQLLSTRGASTAAEAAEASGLPLRTVQGSLQELVAEGICSAAREGRSVKYRVEDSVLS